jgi:hypothetical protein
MHNKYWLKFAIVFSTIYLVFLLLTYSNAFKCVGGFGFSDCQMISLFIMSFPGIYIKLMSDNISNLYFPLFSIINIVFYFGLGALIGMIYGKIRNGKVNRVPNML